MLEKYRDAFQAMTRPEVMMTSSRLAGKKLLTMDDMNLVQKTGSGDDLFVRCDARRLSQADVVAALAGEPSPLASNVVERLLGRPIQRVPPAVVAPLRAVVMEETAIALSRDERVIRDVVPNPRRPGTGAHARYALYREGMTVSEFVRAGGQMGDVRWDERRGNIRLEGQAPDRSARR